MHRNRIGLKVAVDLQVENLWINSQIVQSWAGYAAQKNSLRAAGRRRARGVPHHWSLRVQPALDLLTEEPRKAKYISFCKLVEKITKSPTPEQLLKKMTQGGKNS